MFGTETVLLNDGVLYSRHSKGSWSCFPFIEMRAAVGGHVDRLEEEWRALVMSSDSPGPATSGLSAKDLVAPDKTMDAKELAHRAYLRGIVRGLVISQEDFNAVVEGEL